MAAFVKSKLNPPEDTKPDFTGKTVIVTGSNTGLGYEAAVKFVELGCQKVIMAVRSVDKGNAAKATIEERTGHKDVLDVWQLDMLDYDSIKAFATRVNTLDRLDVALLNAGVYSGEFKKSKYGWEQTLQVNVLGTVLLSLLLLSKLKQSKTADYTPVLEIVGSGTHKSAVLKDSVKTGTDPLEAYNNAADFSSQKQYGTSKLFVQYAVRQMAALNKASDVTILAACPGACRSELSRDLDSFLINIARTIIFAIAMRTSEQGSRTFISGTTLGEKGHGQFWQHDQVQQYVSFPRWLV